MSLSISAPGDTPWHSPVFDRPADRARLARTIGIIAIGCGVYGFTVGAWRGAELGWYVAIKLPLLMILTVACNGFLNGIFAQLLGSGLGFRQTSQAILECYVIMGVMLGSLAPVSGGLSWILATTTPENLWRAHAFLICFHTVLIAFAGIVAHLRMLRGLRVATGNSASAVRTFLAWTAGNLFVGAQIGYALRPWAATPGLPVVFVREHPLEGNFYLAVWASTRRLSGGHEALAIGALILIGLALAFWIRSAAAHELRATPHPPVKLKPETLIP